MKIKLLIDAIAILSPITGIGRYAIENARKLQEDSRFECLFFYGYVSKELKYRDPATKAHAEVSKTTLLQRVRNALTRYAPIKKKARSLVVFFSRFNPAVYDIYWQPNFIPNPNIRYKKLVLTVHDLSVVHFKEAHQKVQVEYFDKFFLKRLSRADHIVTVSHFVKNEIIEQLGFDESRISAIYNGVDHERFRPMERSELEATCDKFTLPEQFILFVGSIEPRKNLLGLLKAYNGLPDELKSAYPLILAGFKGWNNAEIMREIDRSKAHIRYLGYLEDTELVHLYNLATLFVYPSLYEGFGIPVLEAMACGTPVLTSNVASLPEVCGDAAIFADPRDSAQICSKLQRLLQDETLREALVQKGIKQAAKFSWVQSASQHAALFKALLEE